MKLSAKTVDAILARFMDEDKHLSDIAGSYGEPGYVIWPACDDGEETPRVVLGDWWCRCGKSDLVEGLHDIGAHWPKLWARLEEQGVEFVWHDEWMVDYETNQAYRTQPDSYSWQPSVVMTDDGEWLTPSDDLGTWVEWAKDSASRCIPTTIANGKDLEELGFTCHERGLESGFHPGQDANPSAVRAEIMRERPDAEVVFLLDSTGQFDIGFSAWYRVQD